MPDFILLMHSDGDPTPDDAWPAYFARLRAANAFNGGSAIGPGATYRKAGAPQPLTAGFTGYIRIDAANLDAARALLDGNPVYEAGGTVEIRELPRDDS